MLLCSICFCLKVKLKVVSDFSTFAIFAVHYILI